MKTNLHKEEGVFLQIVVENLGVDSYVKISIRHLTFRASSVNTGREL